MNTRKNTKPASPSFDYLKLEDVGQNLIYTASLMQLMSEEFDDFNTLLFQIDKAKTELEKKQAVNLLISQIGGRSEIIESLRATVSNQIYNQISNIDGLVDAYIDDNKKARSSEAQK